MCPPALLGDDHLGLVPVELEPQRPVAEVDLGPGPRTPGVQWHGAEARSRTAVRGVDTVGTLSELVRRAELGAAPRGAHGRREPRRGRQHGAEVERRGVPGGPGPRGIGGTGPAWQV